jgi:hypothetical protein
MSTEKITPRTTAGRVPKVVIAAKDPSRGHFYVSLAKSALRIVAGIVLIMGDFVLCGALLVAAEVLGIAEELV